MVVYCFCAMFFPFKEAAGIKIQKYYSMLPRNCIFTFFHNGGSASSQGMTNTLFPQSFYRYIFNRRTMPLQRSPPMRAARKQVPPPFFQWQPALSPTLKSSEINRPTNIFDRSLHNFSECFPFLWRININFSYYG